MMHCTDYVFHYILIDKITRLICFSYLFLFIYLFIYFISDVFLIYFYLFIYLFILFILFHLKR